MTTLYWWARQNWALMYNQRRRHFDNPQMNFSGMFLDLNFCYNILKLNCAHMTLAFAVAHWTSIIESIFRRLRKHVYKLLLSSNTILGHVLKYTRGDIDRPDEKGPEFSSYC